MEFRENLDDEPINLLLMNEFIINVKKKRIIIKCIFKMKIFHVKYSFLNWKRKILS